MELLLNSMRVQHRTSGPVSSTAIRVLVLSSLLRQSDYHHNVAYSIYMITNNIKGFYADLMSDSFEYTYRIELLKIN